MNVIVPDPSLKDNQVDLGYSCFYVMFKLKIIHYLMKIHDISLAQANSIWEEGYSFDQRIYEIMKMIIEIEKPSVVINRNPTLNYYSIILMDIRRVKPDKDCYTLAVPLSILPGLNADFDGDEEKCLLTSLIAGIAFISQSAAKCENN